jgi:phospholipase/carboxylesterase
MTSASGMLETVEFETSPSPEWAVILLHGLGDSGDGWAPVAPHIARPDWPSVRFVFPHAPVQPVTINGGMRMRSWYDIVDLTDIDRRADGQSGGVRRRTPGPGRVVVRALRGLRARFRRRRSAPCR